MLDSSPVALPPSAPKRTTLKRSASNASLLTPPRTHRRHGRGKSRGSVESDSDENVLVSTDDDDQAVEEPSRGRNKKRKTEGTSADADEDAFWLGQPKEGVRTRARGATAIKSQPLLYRKTRAATATNVAPVSPPPSNRKPPPAAPVTPKRPTVPLFDRQVTASPPVTPKTRSATKRALRDSPENPFLSTPTKDGESPPETSASPTTPLLDKPWVTYVFRGTRRQYRNPHYNHAEGRPLSPNPASNLPVEHPDYSPDMICAPKLLFPEARGKKKGKAVATRSRARSPSVSSDEAADLEVHPKKLDFGAQKKVRSVKAKAKKTLDQELMTAAAGDPFSP